MDITRNFLSAIACLVLIFPGVVWADSLYLYIGHDFSPDQSVVEVPPGVSGTLPPGAGPGILPPYTSSDFISGGFDLASPLGPDLVAATIVPEYFFFEDGVQSTTAGVTSSSFTVWTDADGDIDDWGISLVLTSGQVINTVSDPRLKDKEGQYGGIFDDTFFSPYDVSSTRGRAANIGDPGTWEDITGDGAACAVPRARAPRVGAAGDGAAWDGGGAAPRTRLRPAWRRQSRV